MNDKRLFGNVRKPEDNDIGVTPLIELLDTNIVMMKAEIKALTKTNSEVYWSDSKKKIREHMKKAFHYMEEIEGHLQHTYRTYRS